MGRAKKKTEDEDDDCGQIVARFKSLRAEFAEAHPQGTRSVLRLTEDQLNEFRRCENESWRSLNYEPRGAEMAPMKFGGPEHAIPALRQILQSQGVADVKLVQSGDMQLVPFKEEK